MRRWTRLPWVSVWNARVSSSVLACSGGLGPSPVSGAGAATGPATGTGTLPWARRTASTKSIGVVAVPKIRSGSSTPQACSSRDSSSTRARLSSPSSASRRLSSRTSGAPAVCWSSATRSCTFRRTSASSSIWLASCVSDMTSTRYAASETVDQRQASLGVRSWVHGRSYGPMQAIGRQRLETTMQRNRSLMVSYHGDQRPLPSHSRSQLGLHYRDRTCARTTRRRHGHRNARRLHVDCWMEGTDSRELNRELLSSLRRVERRTRLRSEWTVNGVTDRFFDYVPKGTRPASPDQSGR